MAMNRNTRIILTIFLAAIGFVSFFGFASKAARQPSDSNDPKGIQNILTRKSQQILTVWAVVQTVDGLINVLEKVNPGFGILSPLDNVLDKLSDVLLYALGAVVMEKLLLSLSGFIVFKIIIPVCLLLCILTLWIKGDAERIRRIIPVFVLIVVSIACAIPGSLQLGVIIEKQFFTDKISILLADIADTGKNAEKIESDVNGSVETDTKTREGGFLDKLKDSVNTVTSQVSSAVSSAASLITNIPVFISNAKKLSDALIENVMNYIVIFLITNIVIPILTIYGIICVTKYAVKLIMKENSNVLPPKTIQE